MKLTTITAAIALTLATATTAFAAPEVEVQLLGGQMTAPSNTKITNDNVDGASNDIDRIERELGLNSKHVSAQFAPGMRLGVRLGDSPVIVQAGARYGDHLKLSYDAGLRYNTKGSNFGAEARVVRFDDADVRNAFGGSVEGEALVTYDVGILRLGAGASTATIGSKSVTGLVTADLVFKFGGQSKVATVLAPVTKVIQPKAPKAPVAAPRIEEKTGERG